MRHAAARRLDGFLSGNPALLGVAGLGFAVSFQTIAHLATAHHLPGSPYLYPVIIDVGILAMVIESRKAIEAKRIDLVPRLLAWALIGLTLYVNAHGAAPHDWLGRALHVVGPALWAALLELTRWRRIARRKAADKRDGIPAARWAAAPWSSLLMHRRMVLRNVTSYALAVELEDARLFARDLTRAHFGRWWRGKAPRVLVARIRSGRLGDDVTGPAAAAVAAGGTGGWEAAVRAVVTAAVTEGDKLDLAVREQRREIRRQADDAGDEPATPPGPAKRQTRQLTRAAENRATVLRIKKANPGMTVAQVAVRARVSKRTAQRALSGAPDLFAVGSEPDRRGKAEPPLAQAQLGAPRAPWKGE